MVIFFFVVCLSFGSVILPAGASGVISVFGNATLPGNSVDLGYMIVEVPPGALSDGDTMALTLPDGFSFNTSQPVQLSSALGSASESTVSVVYPSLSGRANAVDGLITAGYSGKSTLRIAVNGSPLPNEKSIVYIYMRGIKTPSDYRGEVGLSMDSTGGWPNSLNGTLGYDYKKELNEEEPPQPAEPEKDTVLPVKVNASFRIGDLTYTVDGTALTMDAAPFIRDGRTYVPVRYVAMASGIPEKNIIYENNTVTIQNGEQWIKLLPGSKNMETNKGPVNMDVPALLENGRTFLPVRWVCEAFDLKVQWIDESQTVLINN
jgi:hypothetical protein